MEIELRRHLPPAERIEVFLKGNPDLTWEEAEVRLSSLWVDCPAKGGEVSLGESCCQGCPHLKHIDYPNLKINCNYEPTPIRQLELILERDNEVLLVVCPLTERVVGALAGCGSCLYYRGEEETQPHRTQLGEQVGWLHCACPQTQEPKKRKGPVTIEY